MQQRHMHHPTLGRRYLMHTPLLRYAWLAPVLIGMLIATSAPASAFVLRICKSGVCQDGYDIISPSTFSQPERRLLVSSVLGTLSCGTPDAVLTGEPHLRIDGRSYLLNRSLSTGAPPVAIDGLNRRVTVNLDPSSKASINCQTTGQSRLNLAVENLIPTPFDGTIVPLAESVRLITDGEQLVMQMRPVRPVLCADFGGPTGRLRLELRDPDGRVSINSYLRETPAGEPVSYLPDGGSFGGGLVYLHNRFNLICYVTPPTFVASAGGGEFREGTVVPPVEGSGGQDQLFRSSFEQASVDLEAQVMFNAGAPPRVGQPFTYRIRVRNLGADPATSVQVSEYFSATALTNTGWQCNSISEFPATAVCGSAGNGAAQTGVVKDIGAIIGPGGVLEYEVTRIVIAGAGTNFRIAAGVFGGNEDFDKSLGNNMSGLDLSVQLP